MKDKVVFFLLGVLIVLTFLTLVGAKNQQVGRYQISAWGDETGYGYVIIDTLTGKITTDTSKLDLFDPQRNRGFYTYR